MRQGHNYPKDITESDIRYLHKYYLHKHQAHNHRRHMNRPNIHYHHKHLGHKSQSHKNLHHKQPLCNHHQHSQQLHLLGFHIDYLDKNHSLHIRAIDSILDNSSFDNPFSIT